VFVCRICIFFIAAFVIGGLAIIWRGRPFARAVQLLLVWPLPVLVWWLTVAPSNDRNWRPEVARLPSATLEGNRLTIRNLRNFHYRSQADFDEIWRHNLNNIDNIRKLRILKQ
jgi:hypothetical protein